MKNNSELVRLEEFVDNLLTRYKKLKEACMTMEAMLEERDAECAKLQETIAELRSERGVVGERVAGLIERIEQWEREMEGDDLPEDDPAKLQGKLFQKDQAAAK